MPRPGEGPRATTAWRMPTPRSTSCASTCVWPTAGNGSTMASTNMSARSSPKSAASSAGGCGRPQNSNALRAARGSPPRRRPLCVCARGLHCQSRGQDAPAPSNEAPPHPASRSQQDLPASWRPKVDVGRTHGPEAAIVVAVVRMVVVAVRRTRIVWIVVPTAAAQHPGLDLGAPLPVTRCSQAYHRKRAGQQKKFRTALRAVPVVSAQRTSVQRMGDEHTGRKPLSLTRAPGWK